MMGNQKSKYGIKAGLNGISNSVPPPLSKAIAHFIHVHFKLHVCVESIWEVELPEITHKQET